MMVRRLMISPLWWRTRIACSTTNRKCDRIPTSVSKLHANRQAKRNHSTTLRHDRETGSPGTTDKGGFRQPPDDIPPTSGQLLKHGLRCAVPMIGFGFMDNTIMIHAGHFVDATLGVTFGLSTLAAAGIGQIASGIGGVIFGDALDGIFSRALGSRHMTKAQKAMRSSRLAGVAGGCIGVSVGCVLGLVNLLLVDEARVSQLKLRALEEGQEFEFEVEADNERHPGYTTVTVRGPDVDGVLASISAAIASAGCSVVELTAENRDKAKRGDAMDSEDGSIATMVDHLVHPNRTHFEDVFLIKDRATQQAIGNDDLDGLARSVLSAAKDPLNSHSLKNQLEAMRIENDALVKRITILEDLLDRRQIKLVPSAPRQESEEK